MAGRNFLDDYAMVRATFEEDKAPLLERLVDEIDADDDAAALAIMAAAWDAASDYALAIAHDAFRGNMAEFTPYGEWESDERGSDYVNPIRAAASVACLIAQGAAYAAGMAARAALKK